MISVFADTDIRTLSSFTNAVREADIFIASLIFDYDDVVAILDLIEDVKGPRLIFECATELMPCK